MNKLNTIQTVENLNEVYAIDEKGIGGANHEYAIIPKGEEEERLIIEFAPIAHIKFQNGARREDGGTTGVLDTDLLEIVRDRLTSFQAGEFANGYNAKALENVEKALLWLNKRVEDRIERNVLGKEEK